MSPFNLSQILLVGGGLLVLCFLLGPHVINTADGYWCLARVGGFGQCVPPSKRRGCVPVFTQLMTDRARMMPGPCHPTFP